MLPTDCLEVKLSRPLFGCGQHGQSSWVRTRGTSQPLQPNEVLTPAPAWAEWGRLASSSTGLRHPRHPGHPGHCGHLQAVLLHEAHSVKLIIWSPQGHSVATVITTLPLPESSAPAWCLPGTTPNQLCRKPPSSSRSLLSHRYPLGHSLEVPLSRSDR